MYPPHQTSGAEQILPILGCGLVIFDALSETDRKVNFEYIHMDRRLNNLHSGSQGHN